MKSFEKNNSTKKLLELIRTSEQKHTKVTDTYSPNPSLPTGIKTKYLNLGVFITQNDLTLAMTSNESFTKKISIWCAINSSNFTIKNISISKKKTANAAFWELKKVTEFNESQDIFNFEILDTFKTDNPA